MTGRLAPLEQLQRAARRVTRRPPFSACRLLGTGNTRGAVRGLGTGQAPRLLTEPILLAPQANSSHRRVPSRPRARGSAAPASPRCSPQRSPAGAARGAFGVSAATFSSPNYGAYPGPGMAGARVQRGARVHAPAMPLSHMPAGLGCAHWISVDAGGVQAAIRHGGGGADTGFVTATTATPRVVVWAPIRRQRSAGHGLGGWCSTAKFGCGDG
jgi:hypothetical protein